MKTKILEALETKYKTLGLSKSALDTVAELLSESIKQESEIEASISSPKCENLLKMFQSNDDKVRTENRKLKEELEETKKLITKPKKEDEPNPNKSLSDELNEMKQWKKTIEDKMSAKEKAEKNAETLKSAAGMLESKGCTDKYCRELIVRMTTVNDGETVEQLAERMKSAYDAERKEQSQNGIIPTKGSHEGRGDEEPDWKGMVNRHKNNGEIKTPEKSNV